MNRQSSVIAILLILVASVSALMFASLFNRNNYMVYKNAPMMNKPYGSMRFIDDDQSNSNHAPGICNMKQCRMLE